MPNPVSFIFVSNFLYHFPSVFCSLDIKTLWNSWGKLVHISPRMSLRMQEQSCAGWENIQTSHTHTIHTPHTSVCPVIPYIQTSHTHTIHTPHTSVCPVIPYIQTSHTHTIQSSQTSVFLSDPQCWEGYFQTVFQYRIHARKCNL